MTPACPLDAPLPGLPALLVTRCNVHGTPLIVALEHRPDFTQGELELIADLLYYGLENVRWRRGSIPDHAHCHLEEASE